MENTSIFAILILILFLGVIFLQVKLSAMDSKYLGLILPAISFILSLSVIAGYAAYESVGATQTANAIGLFFSFLIANIPTLIFLAIYFGVREKNKMDKQINKMNINDL